MDKQAENELRVFKKFAEVYPYPIDIDSIEKRKPPEPDIFCKFRGGNPIAFEMVECIDNRIMKSIMDDSGLKPAFDIKLKELPSEKKQRIKTNFSDAVISVTFCKDITKDKKRSSIKAIFDFLLTLENGAKGEFDLKSNPRLKEVVNRIVITRGVSVPLFNSQPKPI